MAGSNLLTMYQNNQRMNSLKKLADLQTKNRKIKITFFEFSASSMKEN
jgi:hypothetical protein